MCIFFLFFERHDVICDLLLYRHVEKLNLFVLNHSAVQVNLFSMYYSGS